MATIVGLISDTHGLLRPEALEALRGSALILHAGDVGRPEVLAGLEKIAHVHAVRGNIDLEAWARKLPARKTIQVENVRIHLLHDIGGLRGAAGCAAVVYGHSHRPEVVERDGVLYVNPGSAGPRRFHLPVSLGRLVIDGAKVSAATFELAGTL